MHGAVLGDMIGSPYEFDRGNKTKDFPLFSKKCHFTDDSVMTVAVADALLRVTPDMRDEEIRAILVERLRAWGRKYPHAGYGGRFRYWLVAENPRPYGSYGNGSAMRVSPAGWMSEDMMEVRRFARLSAEITHNHYEGIRGAEAVASCILLARKGASKAEIKRYMETEFGYDLSRTIDEIRPTYHHVETCQETVPEAITAFLESTGFEDAIRTAVSLGGDTDTLGAITGSIAEAYYGIPWELLVECYRHFMPDMQEILDAVYERAHARTGK